MLGFFKKDYEIIAPVSGKVLDLSEVPDQVFAQRLAGDGAAIDGTGNTFVAPADGELTLIFKTCHAFALTLSNGVELLVHIGIDTVNLQGEGFKALAKQGSQVKKGDPIVAIDRDFIKSKEYSLITPVLITNPNIVSDIKCSIGQEVEAGKDKIFQYRIK
ncbi:MULTISPECIES: PTS sugar transporter subunit IIA [Clostridium]|uniref:PTS sugar transporter subunit IIA n=1 Tax=Clostridium TaxID=1485 RepID=UPI00069D0684|nr:MULTISPECIES: PTS glucose transporter subunit IIA [Clostridium]KOF56471.1 PTS glucose transporter subunit IIA [Clostridium sp. DMHC 10]MCD2346942.1 PTS glucose transporter subunit IIA [Clostridium guangxiense]